eukprot:g2177.t1
MQAGPYKGSWLKNNAELEFEGQVPATPSGMRSQGQAAAANHPLRYAVANIPSNAVVSDEKTAELIERLFEVRHRFLPESSSGKITQIHEFLEYLQRGQADAKENRQVPTGTDSQVSLSVFLRRPLTLQAAGMCSQKWCRSGRNCSGQG